MKLAYEDLANVTDIEGAEKLQSAVQELGGELDIPDNDDNSQDGDGQTGSGTQPGGDDQPGSGIQPGGDDQPGNGTQPGGDDQSGNGTQPGGDDQTGGGTQPVGDDQSGNGTQIGGNSQESDNKQQGNNEKDVKVRSIRLTGISKEIAVNKKIQLKAAIAPANASNTKLQWSVNNSKYASVNQSGLVQVKKAGKNKTVVIKAKAKDGSGVVATYKIKIMPKAVEKIKLVTAKQTVKAGSRVTIKAIVNPVTSSKKMNKTLKWTSSNKKYATVNQNGVVKTKKAGKNKKVKITARSTDGSNKKAVISLKLK